MLFVLVFALRVMNVGVFSTRGERGCLWMARSRIECPAVDVCPGGGGAFLSGLSRVASNGYSKIPADFLL